MDDGRSDACTATVLAGWLNASDVEDAFAFGNRVFHLAAPPTTADRVRRTIRRLSGYPGMGVLSCPDRGIVAGDEASAQDLDALARSGVAVLVRAWDDEAFIIAPVSSRMTLETLWECRERAISGSSPSLGTTSAGWARTNRGSGLTWSGCRMSYARSGTLS
jgi:hypothetical protein